MPELLVQIVDETDENFYNNCGLPKAGDVLTVHDFPNTFGDYYLNNPNLRIASTNTNSEDLFQWLNPEFPTDPINPSPTLQFRDRKLDITQLQDNMTVEQLEAITTMKQSIPDPAQL